VTASTVTEPTDSAADGAAQPRARLRRLITSKVLRTIGLRGALILGSLFAILLLASVVERVVYSGQVLPGIEAVGVEIEGLGRDDALQQIDALADRLEQDPIVADADGTELTLDPALVQLRVDRNATIDAARKAGRSGNPVEAVTGFVLRRFRHETVDLRIAFDDESVEGVVDGWQSLVENGVREGDLEFDGTDVVVIAPRTGSGIVRADAVAKLRSALSSTARSRLTLRVDEIEPTVELEDVELLAVRARRLLASAYRIRGPRGTATPPPADEPLEPVVEITIAPDDVAATLDARVAGSHIALHLDHARLAERLDTEDDVFISLPKPASFSVLSDGTVGINASTNGKELDHRAVARRVLRNEHLIDAPFRVVRPERDTNWAKSLGIKEVVSTFTTHHSCCAERVTNIHTAADYMTGTIVEPGGEFSLNDAVGPRTPERGFVSAPVFYGEFTEDFGGGVSQLATTTFNAAFWGGFEIVEHKPHSIYFDRYPLGREATVNYPKLDLRWRNDSRHGVLVQATYDDTSITVTLFGDAEGRVVREENEDGSCSVANSGDRLTEQRCVVILETIPIEDKLIPCNEATEKTDPDGDCPELAPGQREHTEDGHEGYVVEFWRVVERPGREPEREHFTWTYRMYPETYLVGVSTEPSTTAPPPTTTPGSTAPPTTVTAPTTTTAP
jgi:vancomycin resistance protein YoaR